LDKRLSIATNPGDDPLLSVNEAARKLGGISPWTVHAWLSRGRLRRTKVGGRTMIRESELQRVIHDGGKSKSSRCTEKAVSRTNPNDLKQKPQS
jgi:excisionase family DNA binding protein